MDKKTTTTKKPSTKKPSKKDSKRAEDMDIYEEVAQSSIKDINDEARDAGIELDVDNHDNDDREPIGRLEKLLLHHIAENRASRKILKEMEAFRGHLELHHKIIYAFVVFFGAVLIWYGMWQIVAMIPYLNNPVVAVISGSVMLGFAGAFFRKVK